MKKKIFLRAIWGFPVGIAVGQIMSIVASYILGRGTFEMCMPGFVEALGTELTAVTLQTFLCGLLGLYVHDQNRLNTQCVVTAVEVPQEELLPDLSPLDLNTATVEQMQTLPGIGPELAERIAAWREEHGAFTSVEQIMEVPGIGEGKFAALEGRIVVNE